MKSRVLVLLMLMAGAVALVAQRSLLVSTNDYSVFYPTGSIGGTLRASNLAAIRFLTVGNQALSNLVGTGLTNNNGTLESISGGAGTVISVGATSDVAGLSFSGSPVTTAGTLGLTGTLGAASIDAVIARLASPVFTGDPTGPTPAANDNDTSMATTAYVQTEESGLIAARLWQRTNAYLTIIEALTRGTSTNFFAGDGSFKQLATNMIPGLVDDLGKQLTEAEAAALFQATNANLTTLATLNGAALTNLNAAELRAGTVPTARLGSGTANSATYLRGDSTWATPAGGGGDVYTTSNNAFATGTTNTFSGAITFGGIQRTNWPPQLTRRFYYRSTEWDGSATAATTAEPWLGGAVTSGTLAAIAGDTNHPASARLSSASGANSGYRFLINSVSTLAQFDISAGGESWFVFRPQGTNAGVRSYMGWHDSSLSPVDGCYLQRKDDVISGIAVSNSVAIATTTSYTIASNVWYTGKIEISGTTNIATFWLYDATGAQIWTDAVTNGVPSGSGRETTHGVTCTNTNAAVLVLQDMSFMDVWHPVNR